MMLGYAQQQQQVEAPPDLETAGRLSSPAVSTSTRGRAC
jgi:hypothetical protein